MAKVYVASLMYFFDIYPENIISQENVSSQPKLKTETPEL
jgi:hypothetical protein